MHSILTFFGFRRPANTPPTPAQVEVNIRYLVLDIAWFGVLIGTTINFLQVYVVRLGASSLLVSAVTYGPALVNIFWQLPAAQLMGRTGHRMRWTVRAGLLYRLFYLLVALVPFLTTVGRAEWTVLLLVLLAFPMSISSVGFLSVLADAVPADRIAQVVGWRMAALGLTSTLSTLVAGRVLQWLPFPFNYQLLFIVGFIGSLGSSWYVASLHVPDRPPERPEPGHWLHEIHRIRRYPGFVRFAFIVGILQLAIGMMTPLLPLFWVRRLDATDGQISIIVTVASATMVLGSLLMRRMVGRIGRGRALAAGALGFGLYPLLTSFTTSAWWLIPWAALGGFFNAVVAVTLFDNLVANSPENDRANFIAVFNLFVNAALFFGPLIGGFLARGSDGRLGLQVATGIAFVAGLLFAVRARAR